MVFAGWEIVLLGIFFVVTVAKFARDLYQKIKVIFVGKPDRVRTDHFARRLGVAVKEVLLQTRVIGGRPVAGAMHAAVFGGFVFFALATIDHFLQPFGVDFLDFLFGKSASDYEAIVAFWAVLVSIGIIGLAFRRFVLVKISPDPKSYSSGVVALMILGLMLTYLYSQSGSYAAASAVAKANWWLHAAIILIFPHLILRSKHFHIIMAPINIFFRTPRLGDFLPLNLDVAALEYDDEVTLGLEKLENLTRKQRMDFLSCVECRRCTDNCPANLSGQELDPRGFILAGRQSIFALGQDSPVIGNIISEDALGQCTSCGACENICPVGIEHLQVLTGAKRAQALALGTGMVATDFLQNIERSGNALGAAKDARAKLIEELAIPYFKKGATEYLLWLGCVWGYNADARSAVAALVKVLKASGTHFGVLPKESCSGHHSRRQGEEMQFQTLARENMASLRQAGVEKIIAPCPHCLHTIGREYPTLDANFHPEIVHHSQFIGELLQNNRITVAAQKRDDTTTTYHDPCYLGRYEKIYAAPRAVIAGTGLRVVEMERHGEKSMCCGGGSAGFVREQKVVKRVDQVRKEQVRETGAQLLVTACPECKMMLNAAVEQTKDIAEVVAEAL